MNKLYKQIQLYFVNKKILNLEKDRENVLNQRKSDMMLQGLFYIISEAKKITGKLKPLYETKNNLEEVLN